MRFSYFCFILISVFSLCGCQTKQGPAAALDKSVASLVPSDTQALACIEWDKVRKSALYRKYQERIESGRMGEFLNQTGVDLKKDVTTVWLTNAKTSSLFLARGHFDKKEIAAKLKAKGAKQTSYKEIDLLIESENTMAFVDADLIAAGRDNSIRAMLDQRKEGDQLPAELKERIKAVPADDDVWLVSRGGLPWNGLPQRSDVQSAMSNVAASIKETTMGAHLSDDVKFHGLVDCVSPEGAQRVRDALKGMIGFARLSADSKRPELLRALDAFQVDQSKAQVTVKADLSAEIVDQLATMAAGLEGRVPKQLP